MTGSNQISSWDTLVDLKKIRPEEKERQTDLAKPLPDYLLIFPTICQKNRHREEIPRTARVRAIRLGQGPERTQELG